MSSWTGGSTRAWREVRAWVLARDGHRCRVALDGTRSCPRHPRRRCRVCTGGGVGGATHAHHTRGRKVTGDDPRYMVAACEPCNLHLGDPTSWDPQPRPITRW